MIQVLGQPGPPVPRLVAALERRGQVVAAGGRERRTLDGGPVLMVGEGVSPDSITARARELDARSARLLVVSLLGAHPDARAPALAGLWRLEEAARSTGLPVLTLRLAPLVGPRSPLWLKLRARPRLPRSGRMLLNPVAERDVLVTLERALEGSVVWEGWFEVAGPETMSLSELARMAHRAGPRLPRGSGAWEPCPRLLEEQRLSDPGPWLEHFGVTPEPLAEVAPTWAA